MLNTVSELELEFRIRSYEDSRTFYTLLSVLGSN